MTWADREISARNIEGRKDALKVWLTRRAGVVIPSYSFAVRESEYEKKGPDGKEVPAFARIRWGVDEWERENIVNVTIRVDLPDSRYATSSAKHVLSSDEVTLILGAEAGTRSKGERYALRTEQVDEWLKLSAQRFDALVAAYARYSAAVREFTQDDAEE